MACIELLITLFLIFFYIQPYSIVLERMKTKFPFLLKKMEKRKSKYFCQQVDSSFHVKVTHDYKTRPLTNSINN